MAGQPFRSALFNKDKQACYKSVSSILKANELVNLINDLLFSSAAVIYRGDAELHPICIINSIKNFIGDNRESPSKSLLHFAVDYIISFEFRKDDNEILEKIIREGVVSTAFLGDLEDACQSGDWNSSETIMAKIFLASDRSRATMDALAELALQDTKRNGIFIYHLLRAYQFQERKTDNWVFTKCLFDNLASHKLKDAHKQTDRSPNSIRNHYIQAGNIELFSAIDRIWKGDYVRIRGYRRELSYWIDQININKGIDININDNHGLLLIEPNTFIDYAENIVQAEKTQNEKAKELVTLEAIRSLSRSENKQELAILGTRYMELLS